MKQVPDRKKQRQEYLRKRCWAFVVESLGVLVAGPMFILALFSGFVTLCLAAWCIYSLIYQEWGFGIAVRSTFGGVIVTFAFGGAAHLGNVVMQRGIAAGQIPVVPAVTPDGLPANEILVRGSEEPPAVQSEVLLRAAQGQETPKEELLRVSLESKGEA